MSLFEGQKVVGQLEKRRGGYFYVDVAATLVQTFPQQRKTRLLCTLDQTLTYPCGLNHLGDGNFFLIISGKNLKQVGKSLGDSIWVALLADPNPLGVDLPEALEVLLAQDEEIRQKYERLSMGKKRHIIHSIKRIKNIDKQVQKAIEMIEVHQPKR